MKLQRYELAGTYDDDVRLRADGRWCESEDVAKLEESHKEALEALEIFLKEFDDDVVQMHTPIAYNKAARAARTAIAKAKGEQL